MDRPPAAIPERNEIIVYQPDETVRLEVRLENETVWLSQSQMAQLFQRDQSVIARHIRNVFTEGELDKESNMHFLHIPFSDRAVAFYPLDVIISVGYRVKSLRGSMFRRWATQVLKDYLLRGYAVNDRLDRLETKVARHDEQIGLFIRTALPPAEGVLFEGQICDAYATALRLVKSAKTSLVLVDNYIDESVLTMLGARNPGVSATIYTRHFSRKLLLDVQKYNAQYEPISLKPTRGVHDRFLLIDDTVTYHVGASLKDLGKSLFAFSRLELPPGVILAQL